MSAMTEIVEMGYEQALAELEAIVAFLEENQQSLDESLAKYERGQALARHCAQLLDHAELRVRQLGGQNFSAGMEQSDS